MKNTSFLTMLLFIAPGLITTNIFADLQDDQSQTTETKSCNCGKTCCDKCKNKCCDKCGKTSCGCCKKSSDLSDVSETSGDITDKKEVSNDTN